jgi:hypothetical protein
VGEVIVAGSPTFVAGHRPILPSARDRDADIAAVKFAPVHAANGLVSALLVVELDVGDLLRDSRPWMAGNLAIDDATEDGKSIDEVVVGRMMAQIADEQKRKLTTRMLRKAITHRSSKWRRDWFRFRLWIWRENLVRFIVGSRHWDQQAEGSGEAMTTKLSGRLKILFRNQWKTIIMTGGERVCGY